MSTEIHKSPSGKVIGYTSGIIVEGPANAAQAVAAATTEPVEADTVSGDPLETREIPVTPGVLNRFNVQADFGGITQAAPGTVQLDFIQVFTPADGGAPVETTIKSSGAFATASIPFTSLRSNATLIPTENGTVKYRLDITTVGAGNTASIPARTTTLQASRVAE